MILNVFSICVKSVKVTKTKTSSVFEQRLILCPRPHCVHPANILEMLLLGSALAQVIFCTTRVASCPDWSWWPLALRHRRFGRSVDPTWWNSGAKHFLKVWFTMIWYDCVFFLARTLNHFTPYPSYPDFIDVNFRQLRNKIAHLIGLIWVNALIALTNCI